MVGMTGNMPHRLLFVLAGMAAIAFGVMVGSALMLISGPAGESRPTLGTALGGDPAPDFRLTNQYGRAVALSDFRGKPVVLTFLYTHCQDICPLTVDKLRQTLEELGSTADKVTVLAVSTDPLRDDRQAAYEFSARHGLLTYDWHYLTGSEPELETVWRAYGIGQYRLPAASAELPSQPVVHSDAVYVIDAQGRKQALLRSDFTPAQLASALYKLAK